MYEMQYMTCFLGGIIVYGIGLAIALSPVGEYIVRRQNRCIVIRRVDQINFIEPIFREVYDKALELDPMLSRRIRLYINDDQSANAFATGRRTICITEGLLHQTPDMIKATLAHEFGHLSRKDTDVILVVRVGNLMINIIVITVSALITVFTAITVGLTKLTAAVASAHNGLGLFGTIMGWICALPLIAIGWLLKLIIVKCFFGLWTKFGFWIIQLSSRKKEYDADEFSFNCGYGNALCELLASFGNSGSGQTEGLFAALAASHPDSGSRIAKLQALGATYYEEYGSVTEFVSNQPVYGEGNRQTSNVAAFSASTATSRTSQRNNRTIRNNQQRQAPVQREQEYTGVVICASKKKQDSNQSRYTSVLTQEVAPATTKESTYESDNAINTSTKSPGRMKSAKVICPVCGLEVDNNGAETCGFCGSPLNS